MENSAEERPKEGSIVKLQYIAYVEGQEPFDYQQIEEDPLVFRIGSEGMLVALQEAICQMKKGDKSRVVIQPSHGYTHQTIDKLRKQIIGQELIYEITLQDFYEQEELDDYVDRLRLAAEGKEEGNTLLKSGQIEKAVGVYLKALHLLDFEDSVYAMPTKVALCNNLALCAQKQGNFKEMLLKAKESTRCQPNTKGFLRQAEAQCHLGEWEQAMEIIEQGSWQGFEGTAQSIRDRARQGVVLQREKARAVYGKMFG